MVGVSHADQVQQSGHDDVLGAIVGGGMRDGGLSPIHGPAHNIEAPCADVAHETKNVEDVATVGRVHMPFHQQAENKHSADGGHEQQAAHPALLDQVPGARNEPAYGGRHHRQDG